ncbi:effector-associated constant component EACC1 [Yinghuangia seranimata]|uniref:effector-associated constant component EACC1 n=1 Tax=Yinghuangia seranimata TaxID=408067 RepID=UPI00248B4750|nr:hypothetical protein [Yinghuangia seranimata]MDI2126565.1 hypothetical protein [Yinghuangia seranimata]
MSGDTVADTGVTDVQVAVVPNDGLDDEGAERLMRRLRAEILDLDVESVRPVPAGALPVGAKAADPVTIGAVIVALTVPGGVLTSLVGLIQDWRARQTAPHPVVITIGDDTLELADATPDQQQAVVDMFLARHGAQPPTGP